MKPIELYLETTHFPAHSLHVERQSIIIVIIIYILLIRTLSKKQVVVVHIKIKLIQNLHLLWLFVNNLDIQLK